MKKILFVFLTFILFTQLVRINAQSIITAPAHTTGRPTTVVPPPANPDPKVMPAAQMYSKGYEYHLEGDYEMALVWFRKAALQKYPIAQNAIGEYYEKGLGLEPDEEQALFWYRKAADQGYEPAIENVQRLTQGR